MSMVFNMCGGGGGGASIPVYGYAEEKTAPGATGDIQVYPAADMASYCIQINEPNAAEGLVWLKVGSGRFEAKISDTDEVYLPIAEAKIYHGGVWETVNTKLFNGTEWIPNAFVMYSNGINYSNFVEKSGHVYIEDSHIIFTASAAGSVESDVVDPPVRTTLFLKFSDINNVNGFKIHIKPKGNGGQWDYDKYLANFAFDGESYSCSFADIVIPTTLHELPFTVNVENTTARAYGLLNEVWFE